MPFGTFVVLHDSFLQPGDASHLFLIIDKQQRSSHNVLKLLLVWRPIASYTVMEDFWIAWLLNNVPENLCVLRATDILCTNWALREETCNSPCH